jgi:hypothetical protein
MLQTSKDGTDINIDPMQMFKISRHMNCLMVSSVHHVVYNSSHAADHYALSCMSELEDNLNLKLLHPGQ